MQAVGGGPIRVAYLITDLEIGGAQRVLERTVGHIDRRRFHPIVISLKTEGPIVHAIAGKGVRVVSLRMRGPLDLPRVAELYRTLRDFRPHVLHTILFHANVIGRVVGRLAGVPCIVSEIQTLEGSPFHFALERVTGRLANRVVFASDAVARHAARRAGLRGVVIYNGAPEPVTDRAGCKTEMGLRHVRVVATAARLAAGKGMRTFLRAACLLAAEFPDVHFVVIGGGELDGSLREMARQLGLSERVHFAGWRDDVTRALRGCEVFVHASRLGEGFPNAVVEAMIAGVPVVATDAGGTREAVGDGETGILLRERSAESVARAVASLLSDPARAQEMGRRGRERARERFSVETMLERTEVLYEELLRKDRRSKTRDQSGPPPAPRGGVD